MLRTQIISRVKPRSILWHLQGSHFYKNRLKKGKVSGVLRAVLWESRQGFVPALGRVLKTPGCWNPGLSTALSSLKRLINGPNDSKGRATSPSRPVEFIGTEFLQQEEQDRGRGTCAFWELRQTKPRSPGHLPVPWVGKNID